MNMNVNTNFNIKIIMFALLIILCSNLNLNTVAASSLATAIATATATSVATANAVDQAGNGNLNNKIEAIDIKNISINSIRTDYIKIDTVRTKADKVIIDGIKQDILCLLIAYPENIVGVKQQKDGSIWLITKQGGKLLYDDKKTKSHAEKLSNADIQDMMEQIYPINNTKELMGENFDPGRARAYNLLNIVYGSNQKQIEKNLVPVKINYQNYLFNSNNGASKALSDTFHQLQYTMTTRSSIRKFIYPCSGTYNYRTISGTNRLSPHSFGIAIDLASNQSDYWKWASREKGNQRIKIYPTEIIEAFESNNFIWGGKWGHFDILHFEYRPEIIMKGKYFGNGLIKDKPWYFGINANDKKIKDVITLIDSEIK